MTRVPDTILHSIKYPSQRGEKLPNRQMRMRLVEYGTDTRDRPVVLKLETRNRHGHRPSTKPSAATIKATALAATAAKNLDSVASKTSPKTPGSTVPSRAAPLPAKKRIMGLTAATSTGSRAPAKKTLLGAGAAVSAKKSPAAPGARVIAATPDTPALAVNKPVLVKLGQAVVKKRVDHPGEEAGSRFRGRCFFSRC